MLFADGLEESGGHAAAKRHGEYLPREAVRVAVRRTGLRQGQRGGEIDRLPRRTDAAVRIEQLCLRFRQKIQNSSFYAFQQNSAAFRKPFPICLAGQQDPEAVVSDVAPDPAFHIHPFFFFGHFCIHHQITELI